MNWNCTLWCFSFFLLWNVVAAPGQATCTYRLELFDSGGDGWNNASLTITINRVPAVYTLNAIDDDGSFRAFDIQVADGDTVTLTYTPGFAERENSYAIFNPEGVLILGDGPFPQGGRLFTVIVSCPSCPAPSLKTIALGDIRHNRADFSFVPPDPEGRYIVEYGVSGFAPGTGQRLENRSGMARISGLEEFTLYQFYLFGICANGDTSITQGPFEFRTLRANDVGVVDILTPVTACGLGDRDTVRVAIRNFGGLPQTLIPFYYTVNGFDPGIPFPFDGLYTGVVGKDSVNLIEFETTFNFSEPGEYRIQAWTELEEDTNPNNDTTTVLITHIPIIAAFPYFEAFEDWGGGWTVDTLSRAPSWAYGRPAGQVISGAAGGQGAWVTNLSGPYNDNELSYLLSPCLDFSTLEEDPYIAFDLIFITEQVVRGFGDRAWLEMSLDEGATWAKVGAAGGGINWYNDVDNDWWTGDSGAAGWRYTYHPLEGAAGAEAARLRFVFQSDVSIAREGVGIDNVFISLPLNSDLAATGVVNLASEACGAEDDRLTLRIANVGRSTHTGFLVGYSVNSGAPVFENVGALSVAPGQTVEYTFDTPFNSSTPGAYRITAWTALGGDQYSGNDTVRVLINTVLPLPYFEDFERREIPLGWQVGPQTAVTNLRGNQSYVLAGNLFAQSPSFEAISPVIGPAAAGDTLFFEYRFVNDIGGGNVPKTLGPGERLEVRVSVDCGETFSPALLIEGDEHTPTTQMTTVALPLDAYAGQAVQFKFLANRVSGNFWLDIDNINVRRCPSSLQVALSIDNESASGASDGRAAAAPGAGAEPYTYRWSNGDTGKTAFDLSAGAYALTVTDRFGCAEVIALEVGVGVSAQAPELVRAISLAPNPSSGIARLSAVFGAAVDTRVEVFNTAGQAVLRLAPGRQEWLELDLDLSNRPPGLYLVRLWAGEEVRTLKLLLAW